jgi:dCMP deaminase
MNKGTKLKKHRRMTMEGWIQSRWRDDRISWDELWFNMAHLVAMRAKCSRDRVGTVVVSADNVLLSTGYNGAPAGFYTEGWCNEWCPAAISGDREHCPSVHSEVNALLRTPKPLANGTTMYITSASCLNCAKFIAASGVQRVIMRVKQSDYHRDPDTSIAFLKECGVEVVVWKEYHTKYSRIFVDAYGMGPHACHFCHEMMTFVETVHHIDHDHSNDDPTNLAASHQGCHLTYHNSNKINEVVQSTVSSRSVVKTIVRVKPLIVCPTCGLKTTPGWLKRHVETTGHDRSTYDTWRTEDEVKQRTCDQCSRVFLSMTACKSHVTWSRRTGACEPLA